MMQTPHFSHTIVLVGVGGTGMANIAMMFQTLGYRHIVGIDMAESQMTSRLRELGIRIIIGHGLYTIKRDDIVIYSDIPSIVQGPEISQSRIYQGSPTKKHFHICLTYNQMIAEISKHFITIAVAGSNGKTSTTGMLIHTMMSLCPEQMGMGIMGGILPQYDDRGCIINPSNQSEVLACIDHIINQKSQFDESLRKKYFFVLEACEYKEHIRLYDIDYLMVTSIDRDHRDYFTTLQSYRQVFVDACTQTRYQCLAAPQAYTQLYTYVPTIQLTDIYDFHSPYLVGSFHPTNAGMIYRLCVILHIDVTGFDTALRTYRGVGRRMELLYTTPDQVTIYTDYSHHAPAILGNMQALRAIYPSQHICVIFQPHQAQRILAGRDDFKNSLSDADVCYIYKPYTARENFVALQKTYSQLANMSSFDQLGQAFADHLGAIYIDTIQQASDVIHMLPAHSVCVIYTAGDLDRDLRKGING